MGTACSAPPVGHGWSNAAGPVIKERGESDAECGDFPGRDPGGQPPDASGEGMVSHPYALGSGTLWCVRGIAVQLFSLQDRAGGGHGGERMAGTFPCTGGSDGGGAFLQGNPVAA